MNRDRDEAFVAGAISRRLTILGSTGSIGLSTLDVVAHARVRYGAQAFPIEALTAQSNVEVLADQVRRFRPRLAAVSDESRYEDLKSALRGEKVELAAGPEAILQAAARSSDLVMVAIVGAAALEPTLVAARRGATIALAVSLLGCTTATRTGVESPRPSFASAGALLSNVGNNARAMFGKIEP